MQAVFHFAAAVVIFVGSSSGSCCSCCFCSSGKYLLMCQGIILGYIPLLNRCRFFQLGRGAASTAEAMADEMKIRGEGGGGGAKEES